MNKPRLHDKLFNDMLSTAVEENLMLSLDRLPPKEMLDQEYRLSEESYGRIMKILKKYRRKSFFQNSLRFAKRAAVFAAVAVGISFGSLLSVEASRNAIYNSIKEWKEDHVNIYFEKKDGGKEQAVDSGEARFDLQYLPSGFKKSKEMKIGPLYRTVYQNKRGETIAFDQAPLSEEGRMVVDTEHAAYREISINGKKASLFSAKTANDKTFILWQDGRTCLKLGSKIGQDELIRMAESAEMKKK